MSSLKIEVVEIDSIEPHPNADRLELAKIAGWQCVVRKGEFKAKDRIVYIPIDSILPIELESKLFPPESKVTLSKSRVKTIKLRGAISQGLVVSLKELESFGYVIPNKIGSDVAGELGITKYEPPSKPPSLRGNQVSKKKANHNFREYTDIENFKHYNTLFEDGELVYITEKLHGTSARYGWLPTEVNTFWKKIKKFFGMLPEYEFCLGSRHVQLQDKTYSGFYSENVYGKIADKYDLKWLLSHTKNLVIYGEIVGDGIQKGYTYGCGPGEHQFYAYDVLLDGNYLDAEEFRDLCNYYAIPTVPLLYIGPYSAEIVDRLKQGDSEIGGQKIREGIVIKPVIESTCFMGRKVLKLLNDDYLLLKDNTDFH